ncbi:MAG: phosphodiester glycosidase family protein [Armatimonadota bacterium]
MSSTVKNTRSFISAFLLFIFVISGVYAQQGIYNWEKSKDLYPGIDHVKVKVTAPRLLSINCMRIDTKTKGLKFYTTPKCASWEANKSETLRKSTRNFIRESQLSDKKIVAAINADFFSPWPVPWNQETMTNLLGLSVSDGSVVSPGNDRPSFIITKDNKLKMAVTNADFDTSDIQTAVSGSVFILVDGNLISGSPDLHPRTAIGIDKDGRYVFFMTIDGRQPRSSGATEQEVGTWLKYFGANNGINMDGGGSATMAWWNPKKRSADKAELLNLPVGKGSSSDNSVTERFNGNNIGIYYIPVTTQ